MAITFSVSMILAMTALLAGQGELGGSFTDVGDIRVKRVYAYYEAYDDYLGDSEGDPDLERSEYFGSVNLMFKSKSGDIFSVDNLNSIDIAQQMVVDTNDYDQYCQLYYDGNMSYCYQPSTITTFVWDAPTYTESCACESYWNDIPCQVLDVEFNYVDYTAPSDRSQYEDILYELCDHYSNETSSCGQYTYQSKVQLASNDFKCSSTKASYARTSFSNGLPINDDFDYADEDIGDQWSVLDKWYQSELIDQLFKIKSKIEGNNNDIVLYFTGDYFDLTSYYLASDLSYLVLSFFFVLLVLWGGTNSIFLSLCGMYEIIISFPVGLFFWYLVFQEEYITYLMYLGIFIILGVGADDIFVFYDAWCQSRAQPIAISSSLYNRFEWTYGRSAKSMLITSLTTLIAFIAAFASPIWDIRCFGAVNGIMVICDYILVITWFPACVIYYEKHIRSWFSWRLACSSCLSKVGVNVDLGGRTNNLKDEKEKEDGTMSDTSNPMHDIDDVEKPPNKSEAFDIESSSDKDVSFDVSNLRPIERFFAGRYYTFIERFHFYIILIFFFAMIGSTITWGIGLEADNKAPQTFADDHFVTKSSNVEADQFDTSDSEAKTPWVIVYGLQNTPINTDASHPADQYFYGNVKYQSKFDLFSHQNDIVDVCNNLYTNGLNDGLIDTTDGYYCVMNDFKDWRLHNNKVYPITVENEFINNIEEWYNASQNDLYSYQNLSAFDPNYETNTGLEIEDNRVKWLWMSFNSSLSPTYGEDTLDDMSDFSKKAQSLMDEQNSLYNSPTDTFYGFQEASIYILLVALEVLVSSSLTNVAVGVCLAIVIVGVFTRNWLLIIISGISLYTIISFVFSLMVVAGWKINIIEAICITIAAGLSVDYVVHMIHTYEECLDSGDSPQSRRVKVRATLTKMGVSVMSGALTTLSSAMVLTACALLWFSLFGEFLIMVVTMACITSLVLVPSLLLLFGPTHHEGHIDVEGAIDWVRSKWRGMKR